MRRTRRLSTVACACLLALTTAAAAEDREESQDYQLGGPLVACFAGGDVDDVGGACFTLSGDEMTVDLSVRDHDGAPTAATYLFTGPWNIAPALASTITRTYAEGTLCGDIDDVWVPTGATSLVVGPAGTEVSDCQSSSLLESGSVGARYSVPAGTVELTSTAFEPGEPIPQRHACNGGNLSPELAWSDLPAGTVELALTVEDPDTPIGTIVHWVLPGIDAATGGLPEGSAGYSGPCPPPGNGAHRYVFSLYALDTTLGLGADATVDEVREAMRGHVLDRARLVGTYER